MMEGLLGVGANSINNVEFKAPDEEENKSLARQRAVSNARDIAGELASELGISLGNVYSVVEKTPENYYPIYDEASADDSSSSGPSIAGGVVVIESTVEIQYYINGNE